MTAKIKIGAYLYPAGMKTLTGVSMLTWNMVRLLAANPEVELRIVAPADELEPDGSMPADLGLPNVPVIPLPWKRTTREGLWLAVDAPPIDRYLPADFWLYCSRETYVPARRCKRIVTFHHLEPVVPAPIFTKRGLNNWRQHFRLEKAARTADVVIAQSTFTKEQVAERYGVSLGKIHVVGSGVADDLMAQGASDWKPPATGHEPFVLCAGAFHPRKGSDYLIAMARELGRRGSPVKIVCPYGSRGVPALVEEARQLPNMAVLDYMSREDLLAAIRNAVCMVIPSRLEGFGLTAIEAMALQTPVVASNNSALPETLSGAGILVDPTQPAQLADAVEKIFRSPEERQRLVAAGLARAQHFTWARCMDRLLAPLREFDAQAGRKPVSAS